MEFYMELNMCFPYMFNFGTIQQLWCGFFLQLRTSRTRIFFLDENTDMTQAQTETAPDSCLFGHLVVIFWWAYGGFPKWGNTPVTIQKSHGENHDLVSKAATWGWKRQISRLSPCFHGKPLLFSIMFPSKTNIIPWYPTTVYPILSHQRESHPSISHVPTIVYWWIISMISTYIYIYMNGISSPLLDIS